MQLSIGKHTVARGATCFDFVGRLHLLNQVDKTPFRIEIKCVRRWAQHAQRHSLAQHWSQAKKKGICNWTQASIPKDRHPGPVQLLPIDIKFCRTRLCRRHQRVIGEMRIACGTCHINMPQQLANIIQANATQPTPNILASAGFLSLAEELIGQSDI